MTTMSSTFLFFVIILVFSCFGGISEAAFAFIAPSASRFATKKTMNINQVFGELHDQKQRPTISLRNTGSDTSPEQEARDDEGDGPPEPEFGNDDFTFHAFRTETLSLVYEKSIERMNFFSSAES